MAARQPALVFEPQAAPSLRDLAYDAMRDAILSGDLPAGRRIKERDVAEQMGMSTTPVKEALRRLEQDGLVVARPRRGAVVSSLALTAVEEIVEIRADLDGLAARLAAAKLGAAGREELRSLAADLSAAVDDPERARLVTLNARFHALIRATAGNPFITRFTGALAPFDESVRRLALASPAEARRGADEHVAIAAAIVAGDGVTAERLMHAHILRSLRFVIGGAGRSPAGPPT